MKDLTALRLYFPQSARAKPTRFWHRLSAPALSHRLLTAARRSGIHQALLHSVHAGYLAGEKLSHQHMESSPAHHPLCIELIDMEDQLRRFLHDHAEELRHVRAVLFRCEEPLGISRVG
jgi:PII-like signaling protein